MKQVHGSFSIYIQFFVKEINLCALARNLVHRFILLNNSRWKIVPKMSEFHGNILSGVFIDIKIQNGAKTFFDNVTMKDGICLIL